MVFSISLLIMFFLGSCSNQAPIAKSNIKVKSEQKEPLKTGAAVFFEKMKTNKGSDFRKMRFATVVNQTSRVDDKHLIDSLLAIDLDIQLIFAPEHGFRGIADAGEKITNGKDVKTGLPIISLYGKNKKPTAEMLKGIDAVIFDIQDVGARFYTYISTMFYVMQACAENDVLFLILDRPNPNGHYVDGPVLESGFESFVGVHKIPVVHGMTIGEYAQMINGEGWLSPQPPVEMKVFSCENYDHKTSYELPIKPSPNLPNAASIQYYPSLCFFEGTVVSVGRGTDIPFQIYGHPKLNSDEFHFKPEPKSGAKYPKLQGEECRGYDLKKSLSKWPTNQLNLQPLISAYRELKDLETPFFNKNLFFDKLAGTDKLRKQIIGGLSEEQIRKTWSEGLEAFKKTRSKYLLYEDF